MSECDKPEVEVAGESGSGFKFWRTVLGAPQMVVAPMVDQSEAAWRMLSRKYGAQLCFTPMYHANVFIKDNKYRKHCLTVYEEDQPLIVQFCCNSADTLVAVGRCCEGKFAALDLNLGCPQSIARRGHYGAFLQDEWDLIYQMVNAAHTQLSIPITCKIRVFEDVDKTIRYARMLESAGCQMLTVHGRTRDMKGPVTGLADWTQIAAVRRAVSVPVLANGNIQHRSDVTRCLLETEVVGVMTAEGNLHNPALFAGLQPPVWQMAEEYLQLTKQYPCPFSYMRGHIFKLLHYCLLMPCNAEIRSQVARASSLQQLETAVRQIRDKYLQYTEPGAPNWQPGPEDKVVAHLPWPPFICQPHERAPIADHLRKMQANHEKQLQQRDAVSVACSESSKDVIAFSKDASASFTEVIDGQQKRLREDDPAVLSKRKQKKLARGLALGVNRVFMEQCSLCGNPRGLRCEFLLCKVHCRTRCYDMDLDCPGHRILCKTKRQKARLHYGTLNVDKRKSSVESSEGSETVVITTEQVKTALCQDTTTDTVSDDGQVESSTENNHHSGATVVCSELLSDAAG